MNIKKYAKILDGITRRCRRHGGCTRRADAFCGIFMILLILFPFDLFTALGQSRQSQRRGEAADSVAAAHRSLYGSTGADSLANDSSVYLDEKIVVTADSLPYGFDGKRIFNPDPTRAVWLSALFPGLGQVYNRSYWKLPIIVAGFMGLGYGTSWNNSQYQDYTQAYRDLLDSDPSTKSYMNFFPPTTTEESLDKSWLTATMKSRKDYYRRNRDLCIICIVGVYLLCMLDAYVDASLSHFDISPNLSMDVAPAIMVNPGARRPDLGLNWAFTF